jgi:hypothetical protein
MILCFRGFVEVGEVVSGPGVEFQEKESVGKGRSKAVLGIFESDCKLSGVIYLVA